MLEHCFSALQRAEIAEIERRHRHSSAAVSVSVLFNEPKLLKYSADARGADRREPVSVLFNEPKLLKYGSWMRRVPGRIRFSALQRAEIAEIVTGFVASRMTERVSVLFNEPKLLKF